MKECAEDYVNRMQSEQVVLNTRWRKECEDLTASHHLLRVNAEATLVAASREANELERARTELEESRSRPGPPPSCPVCPTVRAEVTMAIDSMRSRETSLKEECESHMERADDHAARILAGLTQIRELKSRCEAFQSEAQAAGSSASHVHLGPDHGPGKCASLPKVKEVMQKLEDGYVEDLEKAENLY